jgi:hypothetical protein
MRLLKNKTNPETLTDQISRIFDEENFNFRIIQEDEQQIIFNLGVALQSGNIQSYVDIKLEKRVIEMISVASLNIPENKQEETGQYFQYVSLGLLFGNFELHPENGQAIVKTYILLGEDFELNDEIFKRTYFSNLNIMNDYFPGAMHVAFGNKPPKLAYLDIINLPNPQNN